ncbi:MAG: molecular chaperone [Dehalococcoidia bacterium]|nr:molecular chaperone [Dehalococcoidia bacterium]
MAKLILIGIPAFLVISVAAVLIYAQVVTRSGPTQPIAFSHIPHVQADKAGADCTFCHRNVAKGAAATVPSVEQCMFCHKVVGEQSKVPTAAIKDVQNAWVNKQVIDWVRVHRMPDHVRFLHQPHILAGFDCATCHGDVGSKKQVAQERILNMGDCVGCHRANGAPTECTICHK